MANQNGLFKKLLPFLILPIFIASRIPAFGQQLLTGRITDKDTGEPVPYTNIVFENTTIGAMSNADGYYKLSGVPPGKNLLISAVGYEKQLVPFGAIQFPVFNIELKEEVIPISEITVSPGENPALKILKQVLDRKKDNDPSFYPDWQSRVYNKIEIDLKNINKPDKKSKLWNQIGFIYDYVDTLDSDGKTFLPIFITETLSDYFHLQDGTEHEKIIANKISGVRTNMVSEFTGNLYTNVNPYNNFINLTNIGLISPLNEQGLNYYRYYLRDSSIVAGKKIYELSFFPKHKQEPVFKGRFWVADSTFALTRIEMKLSENANVNFLRDMAFEKTYTLYKDYYIPSKEALWIDLNLQKNDKGKLIGIIGRRSVVYDNFKFCINAKKIKKYEKEVTVLSDALSYSEQFWDSIRPIGLQAREAAIYEMVDSLKNVPIIKTVFDYIHMFFFGYKDVGKFEIGPYYYMYSFNKIEGNRFRFGGRTTEDFSSKLRLNGYLAYGLKDEGLKYRAGAEYFFQKDKRFSLETQCQHDYELLGRSGNAFMEDNILMSIMSKKPLSKLNMVNRFSFQADKEWSRTFSNTLKFSSTEIKSSEFVPFFDKEQNPVSGIHNTEISLNTRLSPKERTILGKFEKTSLGSTLPIFNLKAGVGIKNVLSGDYSYLSLQADMYDKLPVYPVGYTACLLQAGRTWGDVPFPLTKIHEGNETYAYDRYAFNLMNYQEFISDRYAGISIEHHFQGYFFNKIPLLRKLKWREVIGGKWLIGDLDKSHHDQLIFPEGMQPLNGKTYTELSAGIENILKIIRIDTVWRLTKGISDYDKVVVLLSLQFSF